MPNDSVSARSWAQGLREARAELVKEAWATGEHNVTALARKFGVARDTIYRDLASQGVDARKNPVQDVLARVELPETVSRAEFEELKKQVEWIRERMPVVTFQQTTAAPAPGAMYTITLNSDNYLPYQNGNK